MARFCKLSALVLLCAVCTQACIHEFGNRHEAAIKAGGYYDYSYNGLNWVNDFQTCRGQKQSPILLPATGAAAKGLMSPAGKSKFSYGVLTNPKLVNNGHTLQVSLPADFKSDVQIPIAGDKSTAKGTSIFSATNSGKSQITMVKATPAQFHFHTHSEHIINGAEYPLEMHIVHFIKKDQLPACGDAGCPAVLGIMLAVTDNESEVNPALRKIIEGMPMAENNTATINGQIDVGSLLPADRSYWTYQGSLTTPPCTEGILWHVLTTPIKISLTLLTRFEEAVGDYRCPDSKADTQYKAAAVTKEQGSGPFKAPEKDAGVAEHDPARIENPLVENKLASKIHVACAATAMALHHSFQIVLAAAAATAGPDTGRSAATDLDWPRKAVALVRMLLQLQQLLPQLEVVFASCDLLVQVMQIDSGVWKLAIALEANQELLLLLQPAVLQAIHQADRRRQQQQQQDMIDDTLRLSGVLLCEMALKINSDHWKKAIVASPQVCCASLDVAFRTNGAAAAAAAAGSSSIKMTDYMPPSGFFIAAREAMLTVQLALQEGKVLVALMQPTEAARDTLVQQQHAPFLFSVMATLLKCGAALRQADPENALLVAECVAGFGVRFSVAVTPAAAAAAAGLGADAAVAELAASMGMQPVEFMSQLMSTKGAQAGARGRELQRMLRAASSALSGGSSGSGGDNSGGGGGGRNNSCVTKSAGSWGRFGDIKTCREIVQQGLFDFHPGGYNSSSNVGGSTNVISNVWYKSDQIFVVTPWLVSAARSLFLIGQVLCEVLGEQQQCKQQKCKLQQPQMIASPHLYEDVLLNAFACVEWLGSELCHIQLPEDAVDCDSKDVSSSSSSCRGCASASGIGAGDCSTGTSANSHGPGCIHAALHQLLEQHSQTQHNLLQAVQRCLDTSSCSSNSGSGGGLTEHVSDTTLLQQFEQVWGLKTAQHLKDFAASVIAALPVGYCCNNPGCCNLSKLSELQLVAGSGKLCSQCRVARYCGHVCQKAHWKMHKAACKQLATQTAARPK